MKVSKQEINKRQNKKKIKVTIRIDENVLEWLKKEAILEGLPYQTFINALLLKVST